MFIVPAYPRSSALSALLFDAPRAARRSPAADVAEDEAHYTITLDVPGVAKEDVKVSIDGRRVDVEARSERAEDGKDDAPQRVVYRERSASPFARAFTLPVELDEAASSAKLENGVLVLTLAKRRPAVSRIQIN